MSKLGTSKESEKSFNASKFNPFKTRPDKNFGPDKQV